jgi:hypothetical protein
MEKHKRVTQVEREEVERMLLSLSDESPGTDNIDSKLLRATANHISTPMCHIFNRRLMCGVRPEIWKESKLIPLPKDIKIFLHCS